MTSPRELRNRFQHGRPVEEEESVLVFEEAWKTIAQLMREVTTDASNVKCVMLVDSKMRIDDVNKAVNVLKSEGYLVGVGPSIGIELLSEDSGSEISHPSSRWYVEVKDPPLPEGKENAIVSTTRNFGRAAINHRPEWVEQVDVVITDVSALSGYRISPDVIDHVFRWLKAWRFEVQGRERQGNKQIRVRMNAQKCPKGLMDFLELPRITMPEDE